MRYFVIAMAFLLVTNFSSWAQSNLHNSSWTISKIWANGKPIKTASQNLNFDEQGKVNGQAGCNRFGGAFEVQKSGLKISNIFSTKMACDNLSTESVFLSNLQKTTTYNIKGNILTLLSGKTQLLQFKRLEIKTAPEEKREVAIVSESEPVKNDVNTAYNVDDVTLQRLMYRRSQGEQLNDVELQILNSNPNARDIFRTIKEELQKSTIIKKDANGRFTDGDFERTKDYDYKLISIYGDDNMAIIGDYRLIIPRNNSRMLFYVDCNQMLYDYSVSANNITLNEIIKSNVICNTGGDDHFGTFNELLKTIDRWEIVSDKLILKIKDQPVFTYQYR